MEKDHESLRAHVVEERLLSKVPSNDMFLLGLQTIVMHDQLVIIFIRHALYKALIISPHATLQF